MTGAAFLCAAALVSAACGGDEDGGAAGTSASPTPSPTPAPRDTDSAIEALHKFVAAVEGEGIEESWALYAASIPGNTTQHRADRGCDLNAFSFEFSSLRYLFQQIAPLEVVETYGSALGPSVVELRVRGTNGTEYLATLARAEPYSQDYQLMFLNSGSPAAVPGAPDPFPSPQFPQGYCGIWTGAR